MLDLTLPWATLTAETSDPGALGRIGPVTASQARYLASRSAAGDHATTWRVIVTDDDGRAKAVARMPRLDLAGDPVPGPPLYAAGDTAQTGSTPGAQAPRNSYPARSSYPAASWPPGTSEQPDVALAGCRGRAPAGQRMTGLVGRVTIVIPASEVASTRDWDTDAGGILAAVLATARRADDQARRIAEADWGVPGGCAHSMASQAYRPPPRIREYAIARDVTCRCPFCGQPALRGDLDHTRPWHKGGPTCKCNLGGLCRTHHILKQHLGWILTQPRPGTFQWTTPAGLVYTAGPDAQPS